MAGENSTISVTCPCGKRFQAPASMVGRKGKCNGCGAVVVFTAPSSADPVTEPDYQLADEQTPSGKPPVLAYRGPAMAPGSGGGMWRENDLAVAYRNSSFPMRCVKCNEPLQQGEAKRVTMYWQHPAYYLTLLLGVLIGAVILVLVRQSTELTFGMCRVHRAKRRNKILLGWLIALTGLGFEVLSVFFMSPGPWKNWGLVPICAVLGLVLILGSLIWAVVAVQTLSVRLIKDNKVWFSKCGEPFLASLEN